MAPDFIINLQMVSGRRGSVGQTFKNASYPKSQKNQLTVDATILIAYKIASITKASKAVKRKSEVKETI